MSFNAGSDNPDDDATFYKPQFENDLDKRKEAKEALVRQRHSTVKRVTEDIERNSFNTAISAIMELTNAAINFLQYASPETRSNCKIAVALCADVAETLTKLISPIAPHMAEELWSTVLGHEECKDDKKYSIHNQEWPKFDEDKIKEDKIEIVVQVNGKIKRRIKVHNDADKKTVEEVALQEIDLGDKNPKKIIVVPNRLVNIVL